MSEDRDDDATADEDGGERDGGDEMIIGPTGNRRGRVLLCGGTAEHRTKGTFYEIAKTMTKKTLWKTTGNWTKKKHNVIAT